jgi:hypothetical protein
MMGHTSVRTLMTAVAMAPVKGRAWLTWYRQLIVDSTDILFVGFRGVVIRTTCLLVIYLVDDSGQ